MCRPQLDCEQLQDPFLTRLFRQYAELGCRVRVLDITHDLAIPVYVAVALHERSKRHALGFGCHLNPRVAVARALTELNQLLDSRAEHRRGGINHCCPRLISRSRA